MSRIIRAQARSLRITIYYFKSNKIKCLVLRVLDEEVMKKANRSETVYDIYDVYLTGDGLSQARQRWVKVGIAFMNRDESIHIVLDALPTNGKLQLRRRSHARGHGEGERGRGHKE